MQETGKKILVIDDESAMRHMLSMVLEKEGYLVAEAATGEEALSQLEKESFDVALCDIRMPGMDGLAFLEEAGKRHCTATLIMMSAYGSIDTAIECMKRGAYDFISKPFKTDEVILTLRKAEERLRLKRENALLKRELSGGKDGGAPVFASAAMEGIMELVRKVAGASSPVLITGETGTGKEVVARAVHDLGLDKERPFVAVNCSAISSGLLESELFGHVKGAFTGADRERQGLFGAAEGGTLFLDEIGEMPLELQPKLLRVLQERELRRVGDTRPREVNVRVLAATGRNLTEECNEGRFRIDLFYRLNVVEIRIPPLRERPEDIPPLVDHFCRQLAAREVRPVPTLTAEAMEMLRQYPWPGNIRELRNFVEKTLIFCRDEQIGLSDLPWEVRRQERDLPEDLSLKKAIERMEREYIRKALLATEGNRTHAAKRLEISLRALLYKLKEYDVDQD
ncbi:MAG: hypothetical protein C0617_03250 [Desulfuromonas sp.]|uniref:sigma-54-dependent transcriptional regulator n=1 Tax=Desulfuromonas sp. TaxID=892 RepID=UPI000CC9B4AC|nr:sigma-54 dependent transcriptional regulator [Desulfuromonas sp.]PLX85711.1 MAG: hypothetical protein C0617_03250 [Desulfuromonas sp.]